MVMASSTRAELGLTFFCVFLLHIYLGTNRKYQLQLKDGSKTPIFSFFPLKDQVFPHLGDTPLYMYGRRRKLACRSLYYITSM